jgi:REP element-mobilizing transposase RayT
MKLNPALHHRRSIRLKDYDYSQQGTYFVTVCTYNRKCNLGKVINDEVQLNKYGHIVENEWIKTADIRKNVELDTYVIMPNHLHAIIMLNCRGVLQYAPTDTSGKLQSPSQTVGSIIRGFNSTVTKQINQLRNTPGSSVWQHNYYEHIVRNEDGLNRIREYIINNPIQWQFDRENPHHIIDKTYHANWGKIEELIYGKIKK